MNKQEDYSYLSVDGLENCIAALNEIKAGRLHHCFIELRSCTGSCAGGPKMSADARNRLEGRIRIAHTADTLEDFPPQPTLPLERTFQPRYAQAKMPTEEEIQDILRKLGIAGLEGCLLYTSDLPDEGHHPSGKDPSFPAKNQERGH